jgi:hypothetical protein
MKTCSVCGESKDLFEFYKHRFNADGLQNTCKPCYSNRELVKLRLKEGFNRFKPVNCECCGKSAGLDLDHCHETGSFRGFICRSCNKTLGLAGDDYDSCVKRGLPQHFLDYLALAEKRSGKNTINSYRSKYDSIRHRD